MTILPITLTIAGAAALINVWLALRVCDVRRRDRVLIGDEGNARVGARMRAHSNFVEYTPFFLILLGLVEAAAGPQTWLWAVAILFILSRLAHPFGMERPAPNLLRMGGVGLTWLCLLGLALYALVLSYSERSRPSPEVSYASSPPGGTKIS